MSQLSDSLQQQVTDAQAALKAFQDGKDAYVAGFQPSVEALDPGWKQKAESAYNAEAARLRGAVNTVQGQLGTELRSQEPAKPSGNLTTAPTSGSQADIQNQHAADELKRQQDKDAADLNQKSIENAGLNQRLGIAQATEALHAASAASLDKLRQAQIEGKDVTAALNQAKFDFAQEVAAQKAAIAAQKQDQANKIAQQKNVIDLNGQQVSQGDNRATNAASVLNNTGTMALDVAKGGGTPDQIGGVLGGMLGIAPGFQASMGGAPTAFTPDHFKDLVSLIQSGSVQPDANGNVVPNALKTLAQQNNIPVPGVTGSGVGGSVASAGAGMSPQDIQAQLAMANQEGSNAPQFTAPAAA